MDGIKFTRTHEWAKIETDTFVMGITNHAQSELGDIVFVELPNVGDKITKETHCATLESTKAAAEVCAPLSGEILEVNQELANNPQWINESPYEKGWMVKARITQKEEMLTLLDKDSYNKFVGQENK